MSERIIWPLARSYWGKIWTLTAWCELRQSFRNFRAAISGPQFPGRNFRAAISGPTGSRDCAR
ncbi:MAG: hypothetical protein QF515_12615 [Pseudomonadales bacterium]|jgi:predicted DNA-binding transcriptional regulator YafY|nr:hypothetical protein [Pseudomonadales bacterium]